VSSGFHDSEEIPESERSDILDMLMKAVIIRNGEEAIKFAKDELIEAGRALAEIQVNKDGSIDLRFFRRAN
jgi:hypothetical protein